MNGTEQIEIKLIKIVFPYFYVHKDYKKILLRVLPEGLRGAWASTFMLHVPLPGGMRLPLMQGQF